MDGPERWHDILEATFDNESLLGTQKVATALLSEREALTDIPWMEASGTYGHRNRWRLGFSAGWQTDTFGQTAIDSASVFKELFYGDGEVPGHFHGLARRFDTINPGRTQNAVNIIDGGADGGSSLWLIGWHPRTVYVAYPKGSEAGFMRSGYGGAPDGLRFGLVVEDWRYVVRAANLPILTEGPLYTVANKMACQIALADGVRYGFYAGRSLHEAWGKEKHAWAPFHMVPELRDDEPRIV